MSDPGSGPSLVVPGATGGGGQGQGSRPGGGGVIKIDVTEATFQAEVVDRSATIPIVIDFWADWCGPCKQLSPVLERLAAEYGGAWVLAKIDIEANPRLAQAFQVQSIPMVIAVVGGQAVQGFAGVQPEAAIRRWLDAVLKAAGVEAEPPEDPRQAAADKALATGDLTTAERGYQEILREVPGSPEAQSGLARVALARRVDGLDRTGALAAARADAAGVDAQLLAADMEASGGDGDAAYRRLLGVVRRTAGDDRERVRQHLVTLFAAAGPDDPTVQAARRELASALF